MRIRRYLLFLMVLLAVCLLFTACAKSGGEIVSNLLAGGSGGEVEEMQIDKIYICHYHIFRPGLEYEVDLKNEKFWSYNGLESTQFVARDPFLENQGFHFAGDLKNTDISAFLAQANKLGIAQWDDSYRDDNMEGGHQWRMEITFRDGSIKQISGSNKYPENWAEMNAALKTLTGESLLILAASNQESEGAARETPENFPASKNYIYADLCPLLSQTWKSILVDQDLQMVYVLERSAGVLIDFSSLANVTAGKTQLSEHISVSARELSKEQGADIVRSLADVTKDWKKEYDNPDILDGMAWKVIVCAEGSMSEYGGSNSFPDNWKELAILNTIQSDVAFSFE